MKSLLVALTLSISSWSCGASDEFRAKVEKTAAARPAKLAAIQSFMAGNFSGTKASSLIERYELDGVGDDAILRVIVRSTASNADLESVCRQSSSLVFSGTQTLGLRMLVVVTADYSRKITRGTAAERCTL